MIQGWQYRALTGTDLKGRGFYRVALFDRDGRWFHTWHNTALDSWAYAQSLADWLNYA